MRQWVPSFNKKQTEAGNLLAFFSRQLRPTQRGSIVLSTVSYWPCTSSFDTSTISWKEDPSWPTRTTNRWHLPLLGYHNHGQPDSSDIWRPFQSSQPTSSTCFSGKNNLVANALSHVMVASLNEGVDFPAMAQTQYGDPEIHANRTALTNLRFEEVTNENSPFTLLCNISTGQQRPVVPASWRRRVLEAIHDLSHPGIRNTCRLVSKKFVWHGMTKQA